jgi:hypothetical protein
MAKVNKKKAKAKAKPTARKVYTPGSAPDARTSPGRGRPGRPMVVHKPGWSRKGNYRTKYAMAVMLEAIQAVKDKEMSCRGAAKHFRVPFATLRDRVAGTTGGDVGRPTELSKEEEAVIVERVILMGTWGFPLSRQDLSHIIKGYLDRLGRTTRFINNLPGPDFMIGFMNRHPELSVRTANLIKRGRAALSHQEVNEFFDRVEKELEGVPPENIWNYDETNLTDDPGAKKAIFKRGVKYAEQIRNHSKSAISMMFCGNAAGDMVPPYIVFKAENLWKGWCLNGPKGSRYNTSPSGWFNGFIYSDWFHKSLLPKVQRRPGKHVLIGDNLSSHISDDVINTCKEQNIAFICLPPNSTDKLQPLDVGYFGPLKSHWRSMLQGILGWCLCSYPTYTVPYSTYPYL